MRKKRRLLSLLLCGALLFSLCPQTAVFAAGTDTGKAIQLGIDSISGYDSTAGYDYIYFGNWTALDDNTASVPIKWRVLDNTANNGNDGLFLLSEGLLGETSFDSDTISDAWQDSDAKVWCEDFYNNGFSAAEQAAVLATTKSDGAHTSISAPPDHFVASENILNGDKVFFLSAEEVENSAYGFTDNNARKASDMWWLRSPSAKAGDWSGAGFVLYDGTVVANNLNANLGARPAFNLDTSSVLFTSAAKGGKSVSGMDTGLAVVSDYDGNEWKLTLLDSSREFKVTEPSASGKPGDTISLNYTGAETGENEYISAIITNKSDGDVLYYGRVAQPDGADGSLEITIPTGLAEGSYTLHVFSEQYNGDCKTDYASAFQSVDLTVTASGTGEPDPEPSEPAEIVIGGEVISGSAETPAYALTDDTGAVTTTGANENNYNIKWDGSTLTLDGTTINGGIFKNFLEEDDNLTVNVVGENTINITDTYGISLGANALYL